MKHRRRFVATAYDRRAADLPANAIVDEIVVDDPYSRPGMADRVRVLRSLRDDPLGRLHARRQIDEAQFRAGRIWQELFEAVEVGRIGAIDPTREAVDGGQRADPISDRQRIAAQRLAMFDLALGAEGASLIRDILGAGMSMEQAAAMRGFGGQGRSAVSAQVYLGRRTRECLTTLARVLGLA